MSNSTVSDKKIKVLVILSELSDGGTERVVSLLLQNLDRSRFILELCVWREHFDYTVPDDIPIHVAPKSRFYDAVGVVWKTGMSLRSSSNIDVGAIARRLGGGGGHLSAGSSRVSLENFSVIKTVISEHMNYVNLVCGCHEPQKVDLSRSSHGRPEETVQQKAKCFSRV